MDLGHGIVTNGWIDVRDRDTHWYHYGLPEKLDGKSVIDVGSADGFFAFEAERRGASRVLSVDADQYRNTDFGPGGYQPEYLLQAALGGYKTSGVDISKLVPEQVQAEHEQIDFGINFSIAKEILGSSVERHKMSVYEVTKETVGEWDIVLFFGVIYHLRHPLLVLDHITKLTKEMMVIQSNLAEDMFPNECLPSNQTPYVRFIPGTEAYGDMTYWFVPTASCLKAWVKTAGFNQIEEVCRSILRAYK